MNTIKKAALVACCVLQLVGMVACGPGFMFKTDTQIESPPQNHIPAMREPIDPFEVERDRLRRVARR